MKTYTLEVSHSGLHALMFAFDLASAALALNESATRSAFDAFKNATHSSRERTVEAMRTRRALTEAHRESVKNDGRSDQFEPAPLGGTDLADTMSGFDETLRRWDAAIEAAGNVGGETDPEFV